MHRVSEHTEYTSTDRMKNWLYLHAATTVAF